MSLPAQRPSGFVRRAQRSALRLARHFGERAALRRPRTLRDQVAREAVPELRASAPALAGASELRLVLADGEPPGWTLRKLRGRLPAGLELTAGVQVLEVDAAVEVDGSEVVVGLAAPLASAVALGDVVQLAEAVEFTIDRCVCREVAERELGPDLQGAVAFALVVPKRGATVEPDRGDLITASRGAGQVLAKVDTAGSWRLLVGRA